MSRVTDILAEIRETEGSISRIERLIALHPNRPSLQNTLASHEEYSRRLKEAFGRITDSAYVDVCGYRLFNEDDQFKLPDLANALVRFQTLYTLIYDALVTHKPKRKAKVSSQNIEDSTFGFGYSFPGSVGFMLTIPNSRLLFGDTELDEAIKTMFSLLQSTSSEQIKGFSDVLGASVIKEAYKWAQGLSDSGLGADINWGRGNEVRANLLIQLPQLRELQQIIEETSDRVVETRTLIGTLVGVDTKKDGGKSFHFTYGFNTNIRDIRGVMEPSIGPVTVPTVCKATIQSTARINYSTDEEQVEYILVSLVGIDNADESANLENADETAEGGSFDAPVGLPQ